MDHSEAVNAMMTEKYLLDELSADERDTFEEHFFDCAECAVDIRAAAAFLEQAKTQLPGLTAEPTPQTGRGAPAKRKSSWLDWWRPLLGSPLIAGPVFAALALVVGYQNLVTLPGLRVAATEPRLETTIALHGATRSEPTTIEAERGGGVVLTVDVPVRPELTSYSLALTDPQGKLAWTRELTSDAVASQGDTLSVAIPGAGLRTGSYSLRITGISAGGARTELEQMSLAVRLRD